MKWGLEMGVEAGFDPAVLCSRRIYPRRIRRWCGDEPPGDEPPGDKVCPVMDCPVMDWPAMDWPAMSPPGDESARDEVRPAMKSPGYKTAPHEMGLGDGGGSRI